MSKRKPKNPAFVDLDGDRLIVRDELSESRMPLRYRDSAIAEGTSDTTL